MVRTVTPQSTEAPSVIEVEPPRGPGLSLARPLAVPLLAYGASRLITTFAVALAAMTSQQSFHRVLTVWDGHWYVRIALHGYPTSVPQGNFYAGTGRQVQSSVAFFPLYSLLTRGLDRVLPGGADVAGVVLALLIGAVATVLVWMVAEKVAGRQVEPWPGRWATSASSPRRPK